MWLYVSFYTSSTENWRWQINLEGLQYGLYSFENQRKCLWENQGCLVVVARVIYIVLGSFMLIFRLHTFINTWLVGEKTVLEKERKIFFSMELKKVSMVTADRNAHYGAKLWETYLVSWWSGHVMLILADIYVGHGEFMITCNVTVFFLKRLREMSLKCEGCE